MRPENEKQVANRREFLKRTGIAAGAVAVGTTQTAQAAQVVESPEKPGSASYRETEHVRTYYDLARF